MSVKIISIDLTNGASDKLSSALDSLGSPRILGVSTYVDSHRLHTAVPVLVVVVDA